MYPNFQSEIVKQGFMWKRSQNKKPFTIVNYKKRWWLLTNRYLIYYDDRPENKGNKKGQVELRLVHTIEPASSDFASGDDVGVDGAIWPFLVGYYGDDDDYTLFVIASDAEERFEWIEAIRKACADNKNLKKHYHPVPWNGRRWNCCRNNSRNAFGCLECKSWNTAAQVSSLQNAIWEKNEPDSSFTNGPCCPKLSC